MQPHPFFSFGPLAFVALSFLVSVPLAPRVSRRLDRWRRRRSHFAAPSPWWVRAVSLLAATTGVWAAATALGGALLLVPSWAGPSSLPGQRVDPAMLAHAVPPLSRIAAQRMVDELATAGADGRWAPSRELERRLVLAAHLDPRPDRAVGRLAAARFRSRAGAFARSRPSPGGCDEGLAALAEALRGGALQELMITCRNTPGDGIGHAAFVVGDFMRAVGGEAESIVSRQPRSPAAEPRCFAGGGELPPEGLPLCRLIHAEHVRGARAEVLAGPTPSPPWAARWTWAMRSERGDPLPGEAFASIDPVALIERPGDALLDQPVAIDAELRAKGAAAAEGRDGASTRHRLERAWRSAVVAASRSAAGRHDRARDDVDDALADLDQLRGPIREEDGRAPGRGGDPDVDTGEVRDAIVRIAVAIAVRGGDCAAGDALATALADDDPLRAHVAWSCGARGVPPSWPAWVGTIADGGDGAAIAEALDRAGPRATEGLVRLAAVPEESRGPVREWLREGFPACHGCGFFERLAHHEARLDGARALEDAELVEALAPIVARFEAVVMNRGLALSLRAGHVPRRAAP